MTEKEVPTISDDFLVLCRSISLTEDRDLCQRRWAGVCKATEEVTLDDVAEITRIIFQFAQDDKSDAVQRIRGYFKAADEQFLMSGNESELRVMCEAIILQLFKKGCDAAVFAAMAVTTAGLAGGRKASFRLDLLNRAEEALINRGEEIRRRTDMETFSAAKVDFSSCVKKITEQQNWQGVMAAFTQAEAVTQAVLKNNLKGITRMLYALKDRLSVQDEELQMLWWVIGSRSWMADQPFEKIPIHAQPLIFAKEIAEFTVAYPGPPSVKALLSRCGKLGKKLDVTIPEVINACDIQQLHKMTERLPNSPVILPIHFAIARKLETNDAVSWVSPWAKVAGLAEDFKMPILKIAELFYRECLMVSLLLEG